MPAEPLLSAKPIAPRERLIAALDVPGYDEALALADRFGDAVGFYKLGLELAASGRLFDVAGELAARGAKVFADLKLLDIPATVAAAVRGLAAQPVQLATVHAGYDAILAAACAAKGALGILAVTVLTSLDAADFRRDLGVDVSVEALALSRARRAAAAGCDGVVASGLEARALREALGPELLIVSPGIRPRARADDQKRVVTPREAFENGADYIVVGRPLREADDPRGEALRIQETIAELFAAPVSSRRALP